jgi:pre-mRNA-processing factor 40
MAQRADYEVLLAPDGREYYHNNKTGESTFAKPDVLKDTDDVFEVDPWIEQRSTKEKTFYYNTITKESRWKKQHTPEKKQERTLLTGIGLGLQIRRFDTAKRLLYELLDQYGVRTMRDAVFKLSTDSIFRGIEVQIRTSILRSYLSEKEEEARNAEDMMQDFYVKEVCRLRMNAKNFFEFNKALGKHPHYAKVRNKFGCYEEYLQRNGGEVSILDALMQNYCLDLSASITEISRIDELQEFDKRDVLVSFSRLMRRKEQKYIEAMRGERYRHLVEVLRHKKDFEDLLHVLYGRGLIYYRMKFKDAFYLFRKETSFRGILGSMFSAKDIFFDFIHALEVRLSPYEKDYATANISHADRMAIMKYFDSIAYEKEEGEI